MKRGSRQSGVTLVVTLIMLIVLTLLVVSAIRFGIVNLKIAQNTQVEVEASAAAQVSIEQAVAEINDATDVSTVAAKPAQVVSTGAVSYTVAVTKPVCVLTRNVTSTELDWTKASDRPCYGGGNVELPLGPDGLPLAQPTECKLQQWEVQADVNDGSTGAKLTMVQGASVRVGVEVACP